MGLLAGRGRVGRGARRPARRSAVWSRHIRVMSTYDNIMSKYDDLQALVQEHGSHRAVAERFLRDPDAAQRYIDQLLEDALSDDQALALVALEEMAFILGA
jgi:hypothetical protein